MWSDSIHAPAFKCRFIEIFSSIDVAGIGSPPDREYPL